MAKDLRKMVDEMSDEDMKKALHGLMDACKLPMADKEEEMPAEEK